MTNATPSARSAQLETWFREYEADHTDAKTKLTHMVGIPMIVLALMALLRRLALGPTNFGLLALVAIVVFFYKHDRKLAWTFGAALFAFYVVSFLVSTKLAWFLFIVGWGLQFLGHYKYEKRSPAFFKNLLHVLIGPAWIVARLTGQR